MGTRLRLIGGDRAWKATPQTGNRDSSLSLGVSPLRSLIGPGRGLKVHADPASLKLRRTGARRRTHVTEPELPVRAYPKNSLWSVT